MRCFFGSLSFLCRLSHSKAGPRSRGCARMSYSANAANRILEVPGQPLNASIRVHPSSISTNGFYATFRIPQNTKKDKEKTPCKEQH
jgi:hypothetical protein